MSDSVVLVWGPLPPYAVVLSRGARPLEYPGLGMPIAASAAADNDIELVTLDGIDVFTASGRLRRRSAFASRLGEAATAARLSLGWFLLQPDSASASALLISPDQKARTLRFPLNTGSRAEARQFSPSVPANVLRLAGSGSVLSVTQAGFPFNTIVVADHEDRLLPQLFDAHPLSPSVLKLRLGGDWVSSPAFLLDTGYLQVLVDLRSDARLFVLRARSGALLSWKLLNAPIDIVGIDTPRRLVAAIRNLGSPELVVYQWEWGDSDSTSAR